MAWLLDWNMSFVGRDHVAVVKVNWVPLHCIVPVKCWKYWAVVLEVGVGVRAWSERLWNILDCLVNLLLLGSSCLTLNVDLISILENWPYLIAANVRCHLHWILRNVSGRYFSNWGKHDLVQRHLHCCVSYILLLLNLRLRLVFIQFAWKLLKLRK